MTDVHLHLEMMRFSAQGRALLSGHCHAEIQEQLRRESPSGANTIEGEERNGIDVRTIPPHTTRRAFHDLKVEMRRLGRGVARGPNVADHRALRDSITNRQAFSIS